MNDTPRALRLHIGFFGRCNAGKSSLINAISGQTVVIVSDVAGTTTDPVVKSMEIRGVGACALIDTAGFDDRSTLGDARREQARRAAERSDVAVVVCGAQADYSLEKEWVEMFAERNVPVVLVLGKSDMLVSAEHTARTISDQLGRTPLLVSAASGEGVEALIEALTEAGAKIRDVAAERTILGDLVGRGDRVVLVMPQDEQAPAGRIILPQVQTLRELLDRGCVALCCQTDELAHTLASLAEPPQLVVTDSQVFGRVAEVLPEGVALTSFSVLMACYKGDGVAFVEGAKAIDALTEQSRVLIAEACTHAPASEDIGRVKLPRMLRARVGEGLKVDVVGGADFPADLAPYDLVIHCGACMFNRRHVLSRLERATSQGVPMTNYGIAIAHLQGVLPKVVWPSEGDK